MSVTTLIANLGGMMGLCLGFSFVSGIEILSFIFYVMAKQLTAMK